ncbi:hypothetical protein PJP10_32755, partial [Mycobacterium kansasii]
ADCGMLGFVGILVKTLYRLTIHSKVNELEIMKERKKKKPRNNEKYTTVWKGDFVIRLSGSKISTVELEKPWDLSGLNL